MYGISLWLLLLLIAIAVISGWATTHFLHSLLLGCVVGFSSLFVLVVGPFVLLRRAKLRRKNRVA
jgi:hypothetical protein